MNTDLVAYYKERAKEYENIYLKPERQDDLKSASEIFKSSFRNRSVFEISCGTGYWTEKIAETASSIFATDINEAVIDIASHKTYPKANVTFGIADFYSYQSVKKYEGLFGGFIWSHIQLQDLKSFLIKTNTFIEPGSTVIFIDNNYVEGSSTPISKTDDHGNTFQERKLNDGTSHLVRKNFPDKVFIMEQLSGIATDIEFISLEYFWILIYKVPY